MLAVAYALLGVIAVPIAAFAALWDGGADARVLAACGLPVVYGIAGFLTGLVGALLYNVAAGWVGGIEIDVVELEPSRPPAPATATRPPSP